jgi:phosphoribosyl 1,2-cyclic phosphate phosphodiesterase
MLHEQYGITITFLGTGTSQGVPLISCTCKVCTSTNAKDNRLRCAIHLQSSTTSVVIDAGPDFRQQMLRYGINKLDAIVFTHGHKDHIAGLDDVRAYNYMQNKPMDVFADELTTESLKREFHYIFNGTNYPGIPQINLHTINKNSEINVGDISLKAIEVMHHKLPVLGYRINNFTYITDANAIADEEIAKFKNTDYLVLNALRWEKHISHFCVDEAINLSKKTKALQTFLTHISHQLGTYNDVVNKLPTNVTLAYDSLQIKI